MKKDILILCQYFYPEYVSSATLPYDTALKLSKSGYAVDVITGYPKEYLKDNQKIKKKETVSNIEIKRVKYISLKRNSFIGRLINYFSFTISILMKLPHFKNYKKIFVYSNPPLLPYVAYLGNKLYGVQIVYVLYDVYPEMALITNSIKYGGIIHKIMDHINRKLYSKLKKLVVLSEDMKNFIVKNREIDEKKIIVIENWYKKINSQKNLLNNQIDKFDKLEKDNRFKVVYTGNLGIAQDSDLIIDFIKYNQNHNKISFVISGHGNRMKQLKKLKSDLNFENLYLYDFLHDEEYERLLLIADTFILSLKKELSGLASPSKLYSYLAAGKPTIAIIDSNSYMAQFIQNKHIGITTESKNFSELTKLVMDLLSNRKSYIEMSQNSLNLFNRFYETDIATEKYVELIRNIKEGKNER